MIDDRRTGKTTRMLERVLDRCKRTKTPDVWVVWTHNSVYSKELACKFRDMAESEGWNSCFSPKGQSGCPTVQLWGHYILFKSVRGFRADCMRGVKHNIAVDNAVYEEINGAVFETPFHEYLLRAEGTNET